jgi:hypothetical protein
MDTLHMASKHITGELAATVKALLGKATRESMLAWLGGVIEGNGERAKMQMDLRVRLFGYVFQRLLLVGVFVVDCVCASSWLIDVACWHDGRGQGGS